MLPLIFCLVWFLQTVETRCSENAKGVSPVRFSVPEDHRVTLCCGGPGGADVVWTHRDRKVLVTRQRSYDTNDDPRRYFLLPDGGLRLLKLDDADGGDYRCNEELVAELQVLTGRDFVVSAGRTLLLPCGGGGGGGSRSKLRWFYRRNGTKRDLIFTWFRNGTTKAEPGAGRGAGPGAGRLGYEDDALLIRDLQPEDGGRYQCNKHLWTSVRVLTAQPTSSSTTAAPAEEEADSSTSLLTAAVACLALTLVVTATVCILLTSIKCRRRKKRRAAPQRHGGAELQPTPSGPAEEHLNPPEETIHYASLGRRNWKERPCRTPPDQNHRNVIYSSVVTRPSPGNHTEPR